MTYEFAPVAGASGARASWSRLVRQVARDGRTIALEYDARGNLAWVHDSAGRAIAFEHDRAGRLVATKLPHPTEKDAWQVHTRYAYDAARRSGAGDRSARACVAVCVQGAPAGAGDQPQRAVVLLRLRRLRRGRVLRAHLGRRRHLRPRHRLRQDRQGHLRDQQPGPHDDVQDEPRRLRGEGDRSAGRRDRVRVRRAHAVEGERDRRRWAARPSGSTTRAAT